ncbi:SNF2 family N-terminal domain-containing protein [Phyllosticta capitalensis]|uniref:SNF2 family N-terminal domain-containing protein n=1 Tax=Phyllosticta capitalensis TaxID=121624 RepID=A0ABR1YRR5_9PEZI
MGEDSLSDFGSPGSPSLRRSGRHRKTPSTYSLKKLTRPESVTPRRNPKARIGSDLAASPLRSPRKPLTARKQVRDEIAKVTKVKRDRFLAHYKDLFLPLLPEDKNYISNLGGHDAIVEYVELQSQPSGVTATLKPHQMAGLSFLVHMHKNGMPCILGDEMGLGKTLQTLSLFQWIEEQQQETAENRPYLVVCPLSVLSSWVSEAKKWTPGLRVMSLHGAKAERQHLKKVATSPRNNDDEGDYKIIVTTYETFKAEQGWFKTAFVWRYVVLDEGHTIKNSKTQVARDFQGISPEYRLVLSGTPLQNDLAELWSIFHWLLPDVFTVKTGDLFSKSFNLAKGKVNMNVMDRSRDLLELLMLRRLKTSPGIDLGLPPKTEVLLYVPLTPMQRALYLRLITHQGDMFLNDIFADTRTKEQPGSEMQAASPTAVDCETEEDAKSNNAEYWRLRNLVMQLRMCCNHPYLITNVQPNPYELGPHVLQASGKFIVLEKLLRELILVRRKKVLIFSGFTGMLDLTEDLITMMDAVKPLRIDGSCGRAKRNLNMRLFNDLESDYGAMLISTKAGGLGITLTAATEVIFLDFEWNPQLTLQAEARAHRIGQKNPVTVYKLCTQGTIEEQMMGRINKKLYLSTKITESMKSVHNAAECALSTADASEFSKTELKSLLRRGAQTLTMPAIDIADMSSWDFEQVLSKCKPIDPAADDDNFDEEKWLNTMERVETAIFDGRRIEKENRGWTDAPVLDLDRESRRTGKAVTVDVDGFAVSKQSLECGEWEAVPTLAGKDPSLAFAKREKRKPIQHQHHCQVCWLAGEMVECSICPRSYHRECLGGDFGGSAFKGQYFCLQHRCVDCRSRASEKGGLLYRCRFCTFAYCEDCVNFDLVDLLDYSLPELEMLEYAANDNAFFIKCPNCKDLHFAAPDLKAHSEGQTEKWADTWDKQRRRPDRVMERKDSMNPLSTSPCPSPTKRNASPDDPYRQRSVEKSPGSKPSPTKKLRHQN